MRLMYEIGRGPGWRVMGVASGLGLVALVIAGQVSCGRRQSEKEQRFEIKGKVVSLDKRGSTVTIAHEAIRGYMDAMTMPFSLKDERLLRDLAEGDSVQATLV